jgi:hypothetical protein
MQVWLLALPERLRGPPINMNIILRGKDGIEAFKGSRSLCLGSKKS